MLKNAFIAIVVLAISVSAWGNREEAREPSGILSRAAEEPPEKLRVLLQNLVRDPPADCSGQMHDSTEAFGNEDRLYDLLSRIVLEAINEVPTKPVEAAKAAMERSKAVSDETTSSWESGRRLRYELLSIRPLLVLRLAIWNQETFVVFAPVSLGSYPSASWDIVQSDEGEHATFERLELFPLWRGPSGNPRLLEVKHFSTCMLGLTLDYAVNGYEWHPRESSLTKIIAKESSFSPGQKWEFGTVGKTITIPYCWSGALQIGGVSAPICSIDTYDLSGDVVRFLRAENDPEDLALVARVLTYVKSRDITALRAVCLSPEIAGKVMAIMPPEPSFGAGYERKSIGPDSEQLDFSDGFEMNITLKRQQGSWRVAAIEVKN